MNWRIGVLVGVAVAAVVIALFVPPVSQNPDYHNFADQRSFFGIPNFWNVLSNLPFLMVGLYGFWSWRQAAWAVPSDRWPWLVLAIAACTIAIGSGYYHAWPDNETLVWDRLPMTLGFMSILAATIGERIHPKAGIRFLAPLLVLGIASIRVWQQTGDLRFYGLIQFFPMLALPLLFLLFPARYNHTEGMWQMCAWYAAAKLFEAADRALFSFTGHVSGHPLKHLCGALALTVVFRMLAFRRPISPPLSTK